MSRRGADRIVEHFGALREPRLLLVDRRHLATEACEEAPQRYQRRLVQHEREAEGVGEHFDGEVVARRAEAARDEHHVAARGGAAEDVGDVASSASDVETRLDVEREQCLRGTTCSESRSRRAAARRRSSALQPSCTLTRHPPDGSPMARSPAPELLRRFAEDACQHVVQHHPGAASRFWSSQRTDPAQTSKHRTGRTGHDPAERMGATQKQRASVTSCPAISSPRCGCRPGCSRADTSARRPRS
jgi:hypothetical protein